MNKEKIIIGTYGYVAAIDQENGKEIWRTSLPGTGYNPVNCFLEENKVYCSTSGKIFILNEADGKIIAQNEMVGLGFGFITFATKSSSNNQRKDPKQIIQQQPIQQPIQINQMIQQPVMVQQNSKIVIGQNNQPIQQSIQQTNQPIQQNPSPFVLYPFPQQHIQQQPLQQIPIQQPLQQQLPQIPIQQQLPIQQPQFIQSPLYPYPIQIQQQPLQQQIIQVPQQQQQQVQPILSQQQILQQFSVTENIKQKQLEEDEKLALSLHQQLNLENPPQQQNNLQLNNNRNNNLVNNNNNPNNMNMNVNLNNPNINLPNNNFCIFSPISNISNINNTIPHHQPNRNQNMFGINYNELQNLNYTTDLNTNNHKNVKLDDLLFVAVCTHVVALDKHTGEDVWRCYLGQFSGAASLVYTQQDKLLVGVFGRLFSVDALTGTTEWENKLPGLRYQNVSIITSK
eukprot:TRINITY_DN1341_c0_g1_i2.p1 TRINITY_DN1341_c0_g1~~TRINITY_DN1341_c0_g1_i2.p1  ORF type:complete len:454 (-),score=163.02 TRINITY_DN1341_c0_g1_i2:1350-2711(-)